MSEGQATVFLDSVSDSALHIEPSILATLSRLSSRLFEAATVREGLDDTLAATMHMLGGPMGNIQLLDPVVKVLRIAAHHGFTQDFLAFFHEVSAENATSCARAFRSGGIVVIEDIELDAGFEPFRSIIRNAGVRSVVSAPLFSHDRTLQGMTSIYFQSPHRPSDAELRALILYTRQAAEFIKRLRSEERLLQSEERLRLAVTASRMGLWDRDIKTDRIEWSEEFYHIFGYQPGTLQPNYRAWANRVHPDDLVVAEMALQNAVRERKQYACEYRIVLPDGSVRWCSSRGSFIYDGEGNPTRLVGLIEDVTDRRRLEDRQRVLVAELQHRTRNLIAVVQSIAEQTVSPATFSESFLATFNARLNVLARVQSLLSESTEQPITMAALLSQELQALGLAASDPRVSLEGPEVELHKDALQILALAIHELATNSLKYGAIASDQGTLSVAWHFDGPESINPHLFLEWVERGITLAPQRSSRMHRGYGRTLIEEALPYTLSARTKFELGDDTLYCSILLPGQGTAKRGLT